MEHFDTAKIKASFKGVLATAICLGGLSPALHADCGHTLTGSITQPNCGMSDGTIQLFIAEGVEVYSIDWSTGDQGALLTEQASGYYTVTVVDWNGCATTAEFLLVCDDEDIGGVTEDPVVESGGEEPVDDDCQLTTFTQGGWGSPPNGNNPGAYLYANFAGAFPNGLTIGCVRKLHLTSAQAVTNYLPGGGPSAMLPVGTTTNPTKYKNVLTAQLVAATLSVGMDAYDAGFAPTTNLLGNAIINSGPFAGHTVSQLLDMANSFIGGCGGSYTASQYNEALSAINENFVGGNTDNGFLSCGGMRTKALPAGMPTVLGVFPNPASSNLTVRLEFTEGAVVRTELLDLTGRVMAPQTVRSASAGVMDVSMDVSTLGQGLYFIRTTSKGVETITRIVVAR